MLSEAEYIDIRTAVDRAIFKLNETRNATELYSGDRVRTVVKEDLDEKDREIGRMLVATNMMIQDQIEAIRIEDYAMNEGEN